MIERAGVLVVDKPRGPTSFDVVRQVRRALSIKRAGHTGTLDPMATGVLIVCLGEATKLVPFLTSDDKAYEAEAVLGQTTDSEDAMGQVTETRDASAITRADCERVLASLLGALEQKPPMYSAVRVDGERLYEKARRGEVVEREARSVTVHALTLVDFMPGALARLRFTVECSKGTYVRTLGSEIGARLGVGAHLTALRRTRAGALTLAHATPLDALTHATPLMPLADALATFPRVDVPRDLERAVRDGKLHVVAELTPAEGLSRLITADGALLAVARRAGERVTLERVFQV